MKCESAQRAKYNECARRVQSAHFTTPGSLHIICLMADTKYPVEPFLLGSRYHGNWLEFVLTGSDLPHFESLYFTVSVQCDGLSGTIRKIGFGFYELTEFFSEVEKFERTRKGEAKLKQFSDMSEFCEMRFRFFSLNKSGAVAVDLELGKVKYLGGENDPILQKLHVKFPVGAYEMLEMVTALKNFMDVVR